MQQILTVYHGSRCLFEKFDKSYIQKKPGTGSSLLGIGMYWTDKKDKALNAYASISEVLSQHCTFRGTPLSGSFVYQIQLTQEEQKKILDLDSVSTDLLNRLSHLTNQTKIKNELEAINLSPNRYMDFSIWARKHQELLKKAGFNCLRKKDIFCFLEPEKIKWQISEAKVMSGTDIPRSLIAPNSRITIQENTSLHPIFSRTPKTQLVLGKDLLSQSQEKILHITTQKQSLKFQLQTIMQKMLKIKQHNYIKSQRFMSQKDK